MIDHPESRIVTALAINAESVAWQASAPCATADFDFIPDTETDAEAAIAEERWCRSCPVRTQCLSWAMLHSAEGYWGGTTTYQRNQLRRVRTRAKCPLCLSTSLVYVDPHELCLACGVSWIRDVREEPIAATPLPAAGAA
ncbi:WhiB family transcriptional regulator [Streptomyces luteogriseus]|uniref:WhiB family transcriptional regulator n=1 Tax=Streptomyces luteogriseus TaxID=68233 RepID=UPI00382EC668